MRVVIVGATGNLGTAVLRRLAQEPTPIQVVGLARRLPDPGAGPPYDRVSWTQADIAATDATERLTTAFKDADAVIHLAWAIAPSHRVHEQERVNVAGTRAVVDAMRAAAVPHLVYASSVGAYAPGPDDRHPVDESWPTTGMAGSAYSQHKATVERMLDEDGTVPGGPLVTRMRPALTFQRDMGSEVKRYFLGRLVPASLLRLPVPVVPLPKQWRVQVAHADDVADAFVRALVRRADGAFNVAGEPVLTPSDLALLLRGRHVDVPAALLREAASLTWHARLQPTSPGWVEMAAQSPVMDTTRVRRELDWSPRHDARSTFRELMRGIAESAGTESPALRRRDR